MLNMLEFYLTDRKSIDKGNFPLNHDCIMKVDYISGCPLSFCYFSCRNQDSGALSLLLLNIPVVRQVKFSLVDDLPDNF